MPRSNQLYRYINITNVYIFFRFFLDTLSHPILRSDRTCNPLSWNFAAIVEEKWKDRRLLDREGNSCEKIGVSPGAHANRREQEGEERKKSGLHAHTDTMLMDAGFACVPGNVRARARTYVRLCTGIAGFRELDRPSRY